MVWESIYLAGKKSSFVRCFWPRERSEEENTTNYRSCSFLQQPPMQYQVNIKYSGPEYGAPDGNSQDSHTFTPVQRSCVRVRTRTYI